MQWLKRLLDVFMKYIFRWANVIDRVGLSRRDRTAYTTHLDSLASNNLLTEGLINYQDNVAEKASHVGCNTEEHDR